MSKALDEIKQVIPQEVLAPLVDGSTLLAITGMEPILKEGPIKQVESSLKKAGKLPDVILAKCKKFLLEPEFEKINLELKELNFMEIQKQLAQAIDQSWVATKIEHLPPEAQTSFSLALGKATQYLRSQVPALPVSLVSRSRRPSDFHVSRFNRIYRTVDDPMTVLSDMEMGCLSRMQVETLEAVYPSLYLLMKDGLMASAIQITSKDKEFVVPYNKLKQISVLLLSSTVPPDLQTLLQQNFAEQAQGQQPSQGGSSNVPNLAKQNETKMQRIQNK